MGWGWDEDGCWEEEGDEARDGVGARDGDGDGEWDEDEDEARSGVGIRMRMGTGRKVGIGMETEPRSPGQAISSGGTPTERFLAVGSPGPSWPCPTSSTFPPRSAACGADAGEANSRPLPRVAAPLLWKFF